MNFNITRRRVVLISLAAITVIPFLRDLVERKLQAAELPHLSETDATAKALKYHHDATTAPRVDKMGVAAKDQFCNNCQFIQAKSGQWRPCQIFPGKAVNENGWCNSWVKRAA